MIVGGILAVGTVHKKSNSDVVDFNFYVFDDLTKKLLKEVDRGGIFGQRFLRLWLWIKFTILPKVSTVLLEFGQVLHKFLLKHFVWCQIEFNAPNLDLYAFLGKFRKIWYEYPDIFYEATVHRIWTR